MILTQKNSEKGKVMTMSNQEKKMRMPAMQPPLLESSSFGFA